jgi:hypothetical protein
MTAWATDAYDVLNLVPGRGLISIVRHGRQAC